MAQLTAAYPPRAGSDAQGAALLTAWWRVLSAAEWLTGEVFERAVQTTLEHVDDYLPTPATFLDICRQEARELAYEAQRALPPPAEPAQTPPDNMARYRAIVKAHAARGERLRQAREQLVRQGVNAGLLLGSDELRAFVQERYAAAIIADPRPVAPMPEDAPPVVHRPRPDETQARWPE